MKKIISPIVLFILLFASCESPEAISVVSNELNMLDFIKKNSVIFSEDMNEITLSAVNIHGKISQVNVHRTFKDSNGESRTVLPSIRLADDFLVQGTDDVKVYGYNDISSMGKLLPIFGRKIKISIESSLPNGRVEVIDAEVYNPELVEIINRDELLSISSDQDVTLLWNRDEINDKPVVISLIGRSYTLTGEELIDVNFTKLVNDTGSFTISREELEMFPENISFDIVIARANQEIINNDTVVTLYNSDLVSSQIAIE